MFVNIAILCQLASFAAVSANPLAMRGLPVGPTPKTLDPSGLAGRDVFRRASSTCIADNCARAVTGTTAVVKPPLSSRMADCNSFFSTTVTPLTTVTVTTYTSTETDVSITTSTSSSTEVDVTVTTTTTPVPHKKRQNGATVITSTPTRVPTYASACSGVSRYSSACNCFSGVTRTTVTAPTSTITVVVSAITTTVTSTTSTTTTTTTTSTTAVVTYTPASCAELAPTYQAPNGERFNVQCGTAYYGNGGFSANFEAPSYRACADACAAANCPGFTFFNQYLSSNNCFLYNTISYGSYSDSRFDSGSPA